MSTTHTFSRELRLALLLVAGATAVIVATEFIVVGLLPVLARDLGRSLAETAWLVSAFALSAAIFGPPLTLLSGTQPPHRVLIAALMVFAVGNLAAVVQPTFPMLMAVRIVQGAALPVFISVGAAAASAMAPPGRRGAALAMANTGFVIGLVVALPAGVALAEGGAWWPSFAVLAALALMSAILIALRFPRSATEGESIGGHAALLLQPLFIGHLVLTVAVFATMFAGYTYLAAWLEATAGLRPFELALALAGFSAVGLIGNALAARWAERIPLGSTIVAVLLLAITSAAVISAEVPHLLLILPFALWGIAHTACVTLCQIRVTLAGGPAPAFAMAMDILTANIGIAIGALAGGFIVDRWGMHAIGYGIIAFAAIVLVIARIVEFMGQSTPCVQGRS